VGHFILARFPHLKVLVVDSGVTRNTKAMVSIVKGRLERVGCFFGTSIAKRAAGFTEQCYFFLLPKILLA